MYIDIVLLLKVAYVCHMRGPNHDPSNEHGERGC